MEIVTIDTLPAEASMSGKNTCYLQCPALNRRSNYGVCLFTINAYNNGKLNDSSDCYSHVGRGYCEALKFQKQEQEAGRALFFKPRVDTGERIDVTVLDQKPAVVTEPSKPESESYMRGWNQVDEREKGKKTSKPSAKKSAVFNTEKSELADAVTELATEEAKVKPKPKRADTSKITSGMSILERARAMAGGS